jgi:hypothetical protein
MRDWVILTEWMSSNAWDACWSAQGHLSRFNGRKLLLRDSVGSDLPSGRGCSTAVAISHACTQVRHDWAREGRSYLSKLVETAWRVLLSRDLCNCLLPACANQRLEARHRRVNKPDDAVVVRGSS